MVSLSVEQMMSYVHRVLRGELDEDQLLADPALDNEKRRDIMVLALYQIQWEAERKEARSGRQRRAMQLLRSFLADSQRRNVRNSRSFLMRGSAGGVYRLCPYTGAVHRVELHKRRWYVTDSYCLHDDAKAAPDGRRLPPADLSLQHMLWLAADEERFLATANATSRRNVMWNGDWARQLREARQERAAA